MIDYEQEIEARLQQFEYLTGKGNVKDCNRTLAEILRLMLGMMQEDMTDEEFVPEVSELDAEGETAAIVSLPITQDGEVDGDHIEITSEALQQPAKPTPLKNAPHGLTKFGNPRRIRTKKAKS